MIDLFLAGLLLICLKDQPNCPADGGLNTAWIVKPGDTACGWKFKEYQTTLKVRFKFADFKPYEWSGGKCVETDGIANCEFSAEGSMKITIDTAPTQKINKVSLQSLPRIDEIDRRFKALNLDTFKALEKINFPDGDVSASALWGKDNMPLWFRSNGDAGGMLPRRLADRLKVSYPAKKIEFVKGRQYLRLELEKASSDVQLGNAAKEALDFDEVDGYDHLHYLLFYYKLGYWAGGGDCPNYSIGRRDAVVLRCAKPNLEMHCIQYGDRDTTFWPVMRVPAD